MIFGSQLTEEQLTERRKGIGASDAAKILAGGPAWVELWKDKTGREVPKRIMGEWDAALRHTTEALQCDWYEHKHGEKILSRGLAVAWPEWPVLRCTLDGQVFSPLTIFEVKHVSSFTPDPINWAIEKYTPQLQHQMIVCGVSNGIMSVMVGMKEPELVYFELDPFFAEVYVTRCKEFWGYVERDEPPPGGEALPPPVPPERMREVDLSASNVFGDFATQWLETKEAAARHDKAVKGLKELVEPDVKKAFGHGVVVSRSKAGALTIKASKE